MHDFVALDPLSISVGVAKLTEADGAGNLSRLAKQPRSGLGLYGLEATTLFCGKGAGGFSLHPCHVANAGVGSAHGVTQDPWGSRSRGKCAVGTHFKGFGFTRHRASSV